jgi:hypothetical protein
MCAGVAIQFIRPARTNPVADPSRALSAQHRVTPVAAAVLERSCRDCHSNDTRWPWYSNVAPVSWWVIDHVDHGRSHLNFSDWSRYDATERARLLKQACSLARDGAMPLPQYTWMHRGSKLSPGDVEVLCEALQRL